MTNDNHRAHKAHLTFEEAVEVWPRYWAGEFQHAIASDYGVNQGRVNEVVKERKHIGSRQVAEKRYGRAA
jgi:hypothetical protein